MAVRQQIVAATPKRAAAAAAAAKARACAADDDADVLPPTKKRPGRPPRATHVATAAATALIVVSLTLVLKTADIDPAIMQALHAWAVLNTAAAALALERGGTYGHLHIQGALKAYAATPQHLNRKIKVNTSFATPCCSANILC